MSDPAARVVWAARRAQAQRLAEPYGGVLSRSLLRQIGFDARAVTRQVDAQRWARHGRQTIAVHTGPLPSHALFWRAVWEVGDRIAVVDGVSALLAAGLTSYTEHIVHVSVPHTCSIHHVPGVVIHKVARRHERDVLRNGLPRNRVAAAAIRGAHWATSDRQAALVIAMPIQQRLTTPEQLLEAAGRVRGRTRRRFLATIIRDVADGAQSLGELDFSAACRRHQVPPPTRQAVRTMAGGRAYLDAYWEHQRVAVEIDGSGHRQGLAVAADNLRQNELALQDERVLRIDLVGLRLDEAAFMDQVRRALHRSGTSPPAGVPSAA